MKISVAKMWINGGGLDLSSQCRNWRQDKAGTQRRMGNRATAIGSCRWAINHLAALQARTIFAQAQTKAHAENEGCSTLYQWRQYYLATNAKQRVIRMVILPRVNAGSGAGQATTSGGAASATNSTLVSSVSWPENLSYAEMIDPEDAADLDASDETLSTTNGYTICDVVVQDRELDELDTDVDACVRSYLATAGEDLLADQFEACRGAFHDIRSRNMGMEIFWAAANTPSGYADWTTLAGEGDHRGMRVESLTYVNLLDQSHATRTADSPGINCPAYRCGIGPDAYVWMRCSALGLAEAAGCYVKFEGPTSPASPNYCELEIPTGTPNWSADEVAIVLNTEAADDDVTTARNKVDVFGKTSDLGEEVPAKMVIYGLAAEKVFEFPTLPT